RGARRRLGRGRGGRARRRPALRGGAARRGGGEDPRRVRRARLSIWLGLVALIAALNYAARFSGGSDASTRTEVYRYSTFVGGAVLYAVWLGVVLLIAVDRFGLLALRPRRSWSRGPGL